MPTITQWAHVGFAKAHDTFAPGLLRVHRPLFATLCAEWPVALASILAGHSHWPWLRLVFFQAIGPGFGLEPQATGLHFSATFPKMISPSSTMVPAYHLS